MSRIAASFTLSFALTFAPTGIAQFPAGKQIPAHRQSVTPNGERPDAERGEIADRADAVVLARSVAGTVTQQGRRHLYDVRIQLHSVLKGDGISAGQELVLRFTDDNPRIHLAEESQPVEPAFGMLFLRRSGDSWQPLRASPSIRPSGEFLLHLPENIVPSGQGDTLEARIGYVIAAALEKWGTENAAALDESRSPAGMTAIRMNAITAQFDDAASMLHGPVSDPAPYAEVYHMLARSISPHVRLVGLIGLIRLDDPRGLQTLAGDFNSYAGIFGGRRLPMFLQRWDVSRFPATVDSLGIIALSEVGNAQLESAVAWALGRHPIVDSLPYLAVLLESPDPQSRAGALLGFCNLSEARRDAVLRDYVAEDAREYCSNRYPITNTERESRNTAYWRNWWQSSRARIEKDFRQNASGEVLPFARVASPARWVDARQPRRELSAATKDEAVRMFLMAFRPNSLGDATTDEEQLKRLRMFLPPSLEADDERTIKREAIASAAKLQEMDDAFREESMKLRAAGVPMNQEMMEQRRATSSAIVASFLRELRRRLSPDGWRQFDEAMQTRANDTVKTTVPLSPHGRPGPTVVGPGRPIP